MPWTPQPGPQTDCRCSQADELCYGGAAGGGKSDALLAEAVRDVALPGYHGLLLRRTYPELEGKGSGLIPRSEELWHDELGGQFDRDRLLWTFPSGATVGFGNLERASSVYAYHSAQFAFIGFDELTTFLESQFLYLLSRLRSPAGIRSRVRACGNPGGRARMNSNLSLRAVYRPRGLLISTDEQLPDGQSVLARLVTVEVRRPDIV